MDKVHKAYLIYRSRKPELQPREIEATLFRRTYAVSETTIIKFIGVMDTVGALGNPLFLNGVLSKRNRFHDTDLSTKVNNAFHALSIDEKRTNFEATLWHQQSGAKDQILEQMWFPGVHSDVGGGYPENETGLSDISLGWMIEKAQNCDLKFENIVLNPNHMAPMHESYRRYYRLQNKYYRPIGAEDPKRGNTNESVHPSAVERYKNDNNYRPKNLVNYFIR